MPPNDRARPSAAGRRRHATVVAFVVCSVLYGASYQQFRHFDLENARGLSDPSTYLQMSYGDYDVPAVRRYRPLVPTAVSWLRPVLTPVVQDSVERDLVAFYLVNFAAMAAAGGVFYAFLLSLGFDRILSLLGIALFLSSRTTATLVGTPHVDSVYLLSLAAILLGMQTGRLDRLAWAYPLMALTKETIFPFMLLPLLRPSHHRVRIAVAFAAAIGVAVLVRMAIDSSLPPEEQSSLAAILLHHGRKLGLALHMLFSARALHDLQSPFALVLVLAAIGFVRDRRASTPRVPLVYSWLIPIAFGFALLSRNFGRMFFASAFVVIPYALVGIEAYLRPATEES